MRRGSGGSLVQFSSRPESASRSCSATNIMNNPRAFEFAAGNSGLWSIVSIEPVIGETLAGADRLDVSAPTQRARVTWVLRGVLSNLRYVTADERQSLTATQVDPGRPEATRAALIPIKKNTEWWNLPQDDRRQILANRSRHIQTG